MWSVARLAVILSMVLPAYAAGPDAARKSLAEAQALAAKGDHQAALANFEAAISIDEKLAEAHAGRAASLLSLKRVEEAEGSVKKALALKDDAGFYAIAGRVEVAKGNVEEARKQYDRAAALSPKGAGKFYGDLAGALSARRDEKLAPEIESALKAAVAANPPDPDSLFNLGQSYVSAGREEGVKYLRRFLDEQEKLPKEKRDEQRTRVAKQMIRAMEILKG
jgi:tetratricopeptide (TPR) repeat protein